MLKGAGAPCRKICHTASGAEKTIWKRWSARVLIPNFKRWRAEGKKQRTGETNIGLEWSHSWMDSTYHPLLFSFSYIPCFTDNVFRTEFVSSIRDTQRRQWIQDFWKFFSVPYMIYPISFNFNHRVVSLRGSPPLPHHSHWSPFLQTDCPEQTYIARNRVLRHDQETWYGHLWPCS